MIKLEQNLVLIDWITGGKYCQPLDLKNVNTGFVQLSTKRTSKAEQGHNRVPSKSFDFDLSTIPS